MAGNCEILKRFHLYKYNNILVIQLERNHKYFYIRNTLIKYVFNIVTKFLDIRLVNLMCHLRIIRSTFRCL